MSELTPETIEALQRQPLSQRLVHVSSPDDPNVIPGLMLVTSEQGDGRSFIDKLDLQEFLPAPRRTVRHMRFADAQSLGMYLDRNAEQDDARVEFTREVEGGRLRYLLRFDAPCFQHGPGWGGHTGMASIPLHPYQAHWNFMAAGSSLTQEDLHESLERVMPTIVEPDGADLYELIRHLRLTVSSQFEQAVRNADGATVLSYREDVSHQGSMEIPSEIRAVIPVALGYTTTYEARFSLRYKLQGGALSFRLQAHPENELRFLEAMENLDEEIASEVKLVAGWCPPLMVLAGA